MEPGFIFYRGSIFYNTYRIWTPTEYGPRIYFLWGSILYMTPAVGGSGPLCVAAYGCRCSLTGNVAAPAIAICRTQELGTFYPVGSSSSCCRSRSDKHCFHHLTLALHLSLCCESDVHESIFMSLIFRFLLMVSLNRRRGRPLFL